MQNFTLEEIEILIGSVERDHDATRRRLVELEGNSRSSTLDSSLKGVLKTDREKQSILAEDLSILKAKLIQYRRELSAPAPATPAAEEPAGEEGVNSGSGDE